MKKNILVFPCGSEIGLEIFKSLHLSTHFELVGGSSSDDHGRFVYDTYVGGLPQVDDADFIAELNKVIDTHNIDYVFPAHDSVVLKLAEEKKNKNLGCEVIASPFETCRIARSKLETYRNLIGAVATPRVYASIEELGVGDFPVFLKPDIGQGSKGTYKAHTVEEVEFYCERDPSLIILEYLPGKEYTIDCFTDYNGKLLFSNGRERRRISNGISVNAVSILDDRFHVLAKSINENIEFNGVWFFQVKERSDGELVLMEIAPRVAGTMGLIRGEGVNLPLLSLFNAEGINISIEKNDYTLEIDRALENKYKHNIIYTHVYIDLDDLIVSDGKINLTAIAFIYQCINDNVRVHLLTRHKKDVHTSLKKYRMESLFDEVIWIKDSIEHKSDYISHTDSIFIDDSFSEREEVKKKKGIPVFDGHMIESLIR